MVEYRIKKLLGSDMLLVRAIINSQKQQGLIFYELEMSVDETKRYEVIKRLSEIYTEKLWSVRTLRRESCWRIFLPLLLQSPKKLT